MLRVARQAKILQLIDERGFVESDELATLLDVTPTTIRRDLRDLSEQELVRLEHGGAFSTNLLGNSVEPLYETKTYLNLEPKRLIGAAAASLVCDGDSIILDSGTTNAQIAHHLKHRPLKSLTVITCDLMVAQDLCTAPHITVIMLGGVLRKSYYSAFGPYTEYFLKNLKADKFFLGVDAANKDNGIFNLVMEEVAIKQLMIQDSDEVIVVCDSSKFGKNAPYKVCPWEKIGHIITDACAGQEYLDCFREKSISVTTVPLTKASCPEAAH
jgi:DeoR/GlpR family transcriptional regulator of sugar metabolism